MGGAFYNLKIAINTLILVKVLLQKYLSYKLLLRTINYKLILHNYFEHLYTTFNYSMYIILILYTLKLLFLTF